MLKCETNTPEMGKDILSAAINWLGTPHKTISLAFEHGQWWVSCVDCGAQWSVNDAERAGIDFFDFEEVSEGDNSCHEQAAEEVSPSITIEELIAIADVGYPDNAVSRAYEASLLKGHARKQAMNNIGDTLGIFIALELSETFDEKATKDQQFAEAIRVMTTARNEIDSVIEELEKA